MDQVDSLEDWVAVKDQPFAEVVCAKKKYLDFHIAWNEVDNKVAITCRERAKIHSAITSPEVYTGLFSWGELAAIDEQLSLIHPSLHQYLPALPEEPRGLWGYFASTEPPQDDICDQIKQYLQVALDICGKQLLISTLFEEHDLEEYFEKISEFKRRLYDEGLKSCEDELQNVLFLRDGSINMVDMAEVYKLEDESVFKWNIAQAELYNYLLQPFLDVREVSVCKVKEAKEGLDNPNLGERRHNEYAHQFTEWNQNYVHALDRIQELYIEYYSRTVKVLSQMKARMVEDQSRFGKRAFEVVALDRFLRVSEDTFLEKMQLLQNTRKQYVHERDKVKQELAGLINKPANFQKNLDCLEKSVYEWQVKIYDMDLENLEEEESLLKLLRSARLAEIKSSEEVVVFYDAIEDVDDISSDEETNPKKKRDTKVMGFTDKLNLVYKKRAKLRNKKQLLTRGHENKAIKKQAIVENFQHHHSIKIRRDKQKQENSRKAVFLENERKKTLQRLQEYKMKYPSPSTLPHQRHRKPNGRSKPSGGDQVDSILPSLPILSNREKATRHFDTAGPTSIQTVPGPAPTSPPPPPQPPCPPPSIPSGPPPPPPPPPPPHPVSPPPSQTITTSALNIDMPRQKTTSDKIIDAHDINLTKSKLKKANKEKHGGKVAPHTDTMGSMLELIQRGVKLRPVTATGSNEPTREPLDTDHCEQLKQAFERMKKKLGSNSDDENSDEDEYCKEDFD